MVKEKAILTASMIILENQEKRKIYIQVKN